MACQTAMQNACKTFIMIFYISDNIPEMYLVVKCIITNRNHVKACHSKPEVFGSTGSSLRNLMFKTGIFFAAKSNERA